MESLSINLKALIIAALILVFTWFYYGSKGQITFLSPGTAAFFGLCCAAVLVLCTLLVRLMLHLDASGFIYPHIGFLILLPLLVLLLVAWLVYSIVVLPAVPDLPAYMVCVKGFLRSHVPYISVVSVILGLGAFFVNKGTAGPLQALLAANIKLAIGLAAALVISVVLLYQFKKIRQPALPPEYTAYKNLADHPGTTHYRLEPFLDAGTYDIAGEPYFNAQQNELIINFFAQSSSDRQRPLLRSFKINKEGRITDSLDPIALSAEDMMLFDKGYIRAGLSKDVFSWAFDGSKTPLADTDSGGYARKMDPALQDKLTPLYFQKTGRLQCEDRPDIKWNGNRYYQVVREGDTLKVRLDQVYMAGNNNRDCREQTIAYYNCPGMDFGLIRLNEKSYYIIKPKAR